MALEANPKSILAKLYQCFDTAWIAEAMAVFDQAKSKGAKGEEFDQIEKIIGSPILQKQTILITCWVIKDAYQYFLHQLSFRNPR